MAKMKKRPAKKAPAKRRAKRINNPVRIQLIDKRGNHIADYLIIGIKSQVDVVRYTKSPMGIGLDDTSLLLTVEPAS